MRMTLSPVCFMIVAVLCFSFHGCDGGTPPPAVDIDHDDHAGHDDHGHADHAAHEHPTEGPHGGHLIELGDEEYHAELLHDEGTHTVTVYLLDASGKQPVAVPESEINVQWFRDGRFEEYALKAVSESDDAAGTASRFEIVDAGLCDALCHEDGTQGRLRVTVDGKPYTGTIEALGHEHHDHAGHDH